MLERENTIRNYCLILTHTHTHKNLGNDQYYESYAKFMSITKLSLYTSGKIV